MRRTLLRGSVLVGGLGLAGILSGDRVLSAAETPTVCLACTGPQCWCESRPDSFCDSATEQVCKCNVE